MTFRDSDPAVAVLIAERSRVSEELDVLRTRMRDARATLKSLNDAIEVLSGNVAEYDDIGERTLKDLILRFLPTEGEGITPMEIADKINASGLRDRDTGNTTVSSILSRLKADGIAEKRANGWCLVVNEDEKGPDEFSSSGPSNDVGPVTGRGRVFPATPPEGSIPSGSTAPSRSPDTWLTSDDLDDEIPF